MPNFKVILQITRTHLVSRFKQTSIAALGVTFGIGTFNPGWIYDRSQWPIRWLSTK
jgi:hypothetical protein